MVDLHSHLIFGTDDGVTNLEDSIKMILAAFNRGYKALIITPHYIEDSIYSSNVFDNTKLMKVIQKEIREQNIDIKIYLGNELMYSNNILELLDKKEITTLNKSRYLLMELYVNIRYESLIDKIDVLINKGIVPIIAHPERYDYITIEQFTEMVEHGALLQMNTGSILGIYGRSVKKRLRLLLKNDLIHIASSDNHSTDNFCYTMESKMAVSKILKNVDKIFIDNPLKILKNHIIK